MNDETLDRELRALFDSESLSIEAQGPAADALLDHVLAQPLALGTTEVASVGTPELEADSVELHRLDPDPSRRWLLVAAIVAVVAAIGIGTWVIGDNDPGPVISDNVPDNGLPEGEGVDDTVGEVDSVSMVVFFRALATEEEIEEVSGLLSLENIDWIFVSQAETYDEFVEYFATDEELLNTISIETMPPSLRLELPAQFDADELANRLEEFPQVRTAIYGSDDDLEELRAQGVVDDVDTDAAQNQEAANEALQLATRERQLAMTRELFVDGVSEEELIDLWDGYPYREEDKAANIARYQRDFAWIQNEPIVVDVAIYHQFDDSQAGVPIATVRSVDDPAQAAAFVMGWSSEEIRFGRIPEAGDDPLRDSNIAQIWARDESSITVPGIGIEGGVSAFADGQSLETTTDHHSLTTTISIPSELPLPALITIVSATPELPGAGVLWLEPPTDEPLVLDDSTSECHAVGAQPLRESVTLFQVEPNFDDENPGLDQETNTLVFLAQRGLEVNVTTESTSWDLDGDGMADTLQRLEIRDRVGSRVAEGYRACGTAQPTRSLWNDPAEGALVVRAEGIDGVEWPRGGLIIGSDELAEVSPGQLSFNADDAWTFADDGLLVRLSDVVG